MLTKIEWTNHYRRISRHETLHPRFLRVLPGFQKPERAEEPGARAFQRGDGARAYDAGTETGYQERAERLAHKFGCSALSRLLSRQNLAHRIRRRAGVPQCEVHGDDGV
jgi:hypothetical protein